MRRKSPSLQDENTQHQLEEKPLLEDENAQHQLIMIKIKKEDEFLSEMVLILRALIFFLESVRGTCNLSINSTSYDQRTIASCTLISCYNADFNAIIYRSLGSLSAQGQRSLLKKPQTDSGTHIIQKQNFNNESVSLKIRKFETMMYRYNYSITTHFFRF